MNKLFYWNFSDLLSLLNTQFFQPLCFEWGMYEKLSYCIEYVIGFFIDIMSFFMVSTNIINAIMVVIKFMILIAMLIFVRGGIPRYRYDFLTKIGWIKFLSLVLSVFLSTLLFTYLM